MKRLLAAFGGVVLLGVPATGSAGTIAFGSLTVAGGELVGGSVGWTSGTLDYLVEWDGTSYLYTYSLSDLEPTRAISHVITEVSGNFTEGDILDETTSKGREGPDTFAAGNSNPGLPASLYGLKWNTTGNPLTLTWSIETLRAPMWGSVYSKDGNVQPNPHTLGIWLYSSGLDLVAAGTAPDCYAALFFDFASCTGFLLVPNTVEEPSCIDCEPLQPMPEPATLALLGLGLLGAAGARRRFGRARSQTSTPVRTGANRD